jgi:DNA-binding XRE family transcriptional regulator
MTTQEPHEIYRALRERCGSQIAVAKVLGVTWRTLQRREAGQSPINTEAWIAVRVLSCFPALSKNI